MIEEIKKLRVEIDGLAQLTKGLKPHPKWELDINLLPNGWTVAESIKVFEKSGYNIIDTYNKTGITIKEIPQTHKEIGKATDSLYLAKAWLGKVLGELGTESPYVNDGNRKDVTDIEPAADVNNEVPFGDSEGSLWRDKNHIEKVDWLRSSIEEIIKEVKEIPTGSNQAGVNPDNTSSIKFVPFSREFAIARTNCYTHLCEARFWLGFELERVKNEHN
jgi:hypothetical protein